MQENKQNQKVSIQTLVWILESEICVHVWILRGLTPFSSVSPFTLYLADVVPPNAVSTSLHFYNFEKT